MTTAESASRGHHPVALEAAGPPVGPEWAAAGPGSPVDVPPVRFCGAPTLDGGVCRQIVGVSGSGRCIHHDPARTEAAADMRRRGAEASHAAREPQSTDVPPPPEPKTLEDVVVWHSWIAGALARGQIDKATASPLVYNLMNLRGALVSRDLEKEVEQLRAQVLALKQPRRAA